MKLKKKPREASKTQNVHGLRAKRDDVLSWPGLASRDRVGIAMKADEGGLTEAMYSRECS